MSFTDMIKKSVLEGFSADVSLPDILISLGIAFITGLFILLIYRLTTRNVGRNRSFEVTLLMMTPISAMIVLTITSNLALSLGMVGALSIIRFRTAIKEPSDTAFMFWAVAAGITAGAHFYSIALVGSLFIGALTFIIMKLTSISARPYLIIIKADDKQAFEDVESLFDRHRIKNRLASLTTSGDVAEAIYEVAIGSSARRLIAAVENIDNVVSASIVDCRN